MTKTPNTRSTEATIFDRNGTDLDFAARGIVEALEGVALLRAHKVPHNESIQGYLKDVNVLLGGIHSTSRQPLNLGPITRIAELMEKVPEFETMMNAYRLTALERDGAGTGFAWFARAIDVATRGFDADLGLDGPPR
jgi:hypothetical protein